MAEQKKTNKKAGKTTGKKTGKSVSRKRKTRQKACTKSRSKHIICGVLLLFCILCFVIVLKLSDHAETNGESGLSGTYRWPTEGVTADQPDIDVQLLTENSYSRPGVELSQINGIVVHYTANPGSTAQENRDYFESLKTSHKTKASSNFVVGLQGEIIQCVPTWEEAYASNDRNSDTISIECCHPDETGIFTDETYWSLVKLCAFLCDKYSLDEDDIIRHYDVTGKICPKFFVDDEAAWTQFKSDVGRVLGDK
jgi:hypothetical protein